jgi:hypothetical protein
MLRRTCCAVLLVLGTTLAGVQQAAADTLVDNDHTAGSYTRYDGGTDPTLQGCSTGRRSQNEPSVAVDPRASDVVVAGSNDYCAEIGSGAGNQWPGYYRSTNGGATWSSSLVPGYPNDTSQLGSQSPTKGSCASAGDPTQAFDGDGRLYYGFICFNRAKPTNGSIYVARYDDDGASYASTTRVERGTPSVWGLFQDKINVTADQRPGKGNVYVAWARFSGANGNDVIYFSRSTDHGSTYSKPIRISDGGASEQFADLAVGPDGAVYLTYRIYTGSQGPDSIAIVKSTDGGVSWTRPRTVATITGFESTDYGPDTCGDGPFRCPLLNYARFSSMSAVAADPQGVHVVWNGRMASGQSQVFARNSTDGLTWTGPIVRPAPAATGHQFFPDIATDGSTLSVILQDSRADTAYSPDRPMGNTPAGTSSGQVVDAYLARSSNGTTWSPTLASAARSNPNYENRGTARSPFFGDYNYVSAAPDGSFYSVWTDSRDLVSAPDPRDGNQDEGFDGDTRTCNWVPDDIFAAAYSSPAVSDSCLSQGGLDQNIYGIGG